MPETETPVVLHYVGYDDDRGGIVSVIRALAATGRFDCVLGVNEGFVARREPVLPVQEFPRLAGEKISAATWWRARRVAQEVRAWLKGEPERVFHGHSRAGLLVALWLSRMKGSRAVASVHCYGRQRWFYRWAARQLGARLFWLSPEMKRYYGVEVGGDSWFHCIPPCVPPRAAAPVRRRGIGGFVCLGGIGAIVAWKRWHLVLEALAAVEQGRREQIRFRHIGAATNDAKSQAYAQRLAEATKSLGLEGAVEWCGEQASAAELLAEVDCLVVASACEPFSVAMLEALQAGVPVLAARAGGACDLIVPGENGWFFRSGDVADLAARMGVLINAETWRGIDVRAGELRQFEAPSVAEQWAQVYAQVGVSPGKEAR